MKSIVYIGTSLDGFIARRDGSVDWLEPFGNEEVFQAFEELNNRIDAVLMGRNSFEKVMSFSPWPYRHKVFVLSSTMKQVPAGMEEKAEILSLPLQELLPALEAKGYSNIYADGGQLIQGLLREDLIDEMTITRVPLLLGEGIPLFAEQERQLRFRLAHSRVFANGLVMCRYERDREK